MKRSKFVKAEYEGHHLEHMRQEFEALRWEGEGADPGEMEKHIKDQVEHLLRYLVENWQNMEVAFHVCRIVNRLIEYKVLSALRGGTEFLERNDTPHKLGTDTELINKRTPTVVLDDKRNQVYEVDEKCAIWETGQLVSSGEGFLLQVKFPYSPIEDYTICMPLDGDQEGLERNVQETFKGSYVPEDPHNKANGPEVRYKALQGGIKK